MVQILHSQGFGSRRECLAMLARGEVSVAGTVVDDPDADFDEAGLQFSVRGTPWPYRARALVVLNKPAGYECSRQPHHHPSVLSLLPAPLRLRGVQPVGRLDQDTTGLLLLTDDGALLHALTSPRRHVEKVYEATLRHAADGALADRLLAGVVLHDGPEPVRATACELTAPQHLRLTITEGRYHQVKRMIAAAGNRCEALHRQAFGRLELPPDLAPGQWRWADPAAL